MKSVELNEFGVVCTTPYYYTVHERVTGEEVYFAAINSLPVNGKMTEPGTGEYFIKLSGLEYFITFYSHLYLI